MRGHFITPCEHCRTLFEHHDSRRRFCIACRGVPKIQDLPTRFWRRVQKTGYCWLWTAGTHHGGYGVFSVNRRSRDAHRVAYELTYGPIPAEMCVCHHCDNPRCVRPDHLFLGTKADNNIDKETKRRHDFGERHARARLTESQVLEIRRRFAAGIRQRQLSNEYGVAYTTIAAIVHGKNWRHLL